MEPTSYSGVPVCENLRTLTLEHVYGRSVNNFSDIPRTLVRDLYPFAYADIIALVERTIAATGDFNAELALKNHPLRHKRFKQFIDGMTEPVLGSWYDSLVLAGTGFLAYRFAMYDVATVWAKGLQRAHPDALPVSMCDRLAIAVTILSIPEQLDESYFMNRNAGDYTYSADPGDAFTQLIDWFIEFLDVYGRLGRTNRYGML